MPTGINHRGMEGAQTVSGQGSRREDLERLKSDISAQNSAYDWTWSRRPYYDFDNFLNLYADIYPQSPFSPYNREPDLFDKLHYHYVQRKGDMLRC